MSIFSFIKQSAIILACGFALSASAEAQGIKSSQLVGEWRSPSPENMGQMFAVRDFILTEANWAMFFRAYGDAAAAKPLFTLRVEGSYAVGTSTPKVAGASEATFLYTHRYLTADSDAGVALFKQMGCTLVLGSETDVSLSGCGFVPSISSSAVEYDLLKLEGNQLYFGDRSSDLSKTRPEKLGSYPVIKR